MCNVAAASQLHDHHVLFDRLIDSIRVGFESDERDLQC